MKNPNRYGTCYKLPGKRRNPYIARAYTGKDEDGKPIYETIGYFKTKTEGNIALKNYNTEPYNIANTKLTLLEVFNLFKEEQIKYIKEKTFESNYERPFYNFLSPLHEEIFNNLRPLHYQKIIDKLTPNYKKSYLLKIKSLLSMLYKFAVMQDIVKTNYSQGIRILGIESDEQDYINQFEVAKMIKNLGVVKNVDIILLLCLGGFRPSEMLQISKFNIDFDRNIITGIGIKTKAGKKKRVPISKIILPYIKERYNHVENYLFTKPNGSQMDYFHFLDYVYKPCLKELKIPYKSPKACRHFWATISKQQEVNDKVRKSVLGHTRSEFTDERYTHVQDEFNKSECEKVDDFLLKLTNL